MSYQTCIAFTRIHGHAAVAAEKAARAAEQQGNAVMAHIKWATYERSASEAERWFKAAEAHRVSA